MGVGLLPDERVLWQASPAHRSVFLRTDPAWIRFSLKFGTVKILLIAALIAWLGSVDTWGAIFTLVAAFVVFDVLYLAEPFLWRHRTLPRTTYYVTDQRVVSVPGRRARSVRLAEISNLTFTEEPDGSGHIRLDQRVMPDGFGNGTVAELIHVPDVREVVTLLSTLTGRTPNQPPNQH
ncbi:hypothetical protein [Lentzea sp. E54]|uniref:hypothetical protein n=1 Tax=Lentzea xerophila TaxID=3435883 RepID=UPI003DA48623